MVEGRVDGQDYWVRLGSTTDPGHGDRPGDKAGVELVFAQPVSWEGMVHTASQPCKGHGNEGRVEPNDPCLLVEREFGREFRSYSDVQFISAEVYLRQQLVANILGSRPHPVDLERSIEAIIASDYP